MLRRALLWASENPFVAERLPRYGFVRKAVGRFMPGEEPDDALREAMRLHSRGVPTLVTQLGEKISGAGEARAVLRFYLDLARRIGEGGLDMELSVKLTQLGLDFDPELATGCVAELAEAAGGLVWIDMESSAYVDRTLEVYRAARRSHENVGICLQSYLRRTADDFEALLRDHAPHVRLVKGAYRESAKVAFPKKAQVDGAFRSLASRMLRERRAGRMGRPAIGTHDARLVGDAQRIAYELDLPAEDWEVQMLYGISGAQQDRLVNGGTPLRVLVSFGRHWFPWYMRRLAERPANLGFVLKQLVRR
jgi:proline dehydrogenase